jgi:hypothetical protein
MRGYVERLEWLEKCSDGPVGYDEVLESFRQEEDAAEIDKPKPRKRMCQRCLRVIPVDKNDSKYCKDVSDCAKARLALIQYTRRLRNG